MLDGIQSEQFVRQITQCQKRVYAYILAILADSNAADDVLQETNVVLWREADQFTPGVDGGRKWQRGAVEKDSAWW